MSTHSAAPANSVGAACRQHGHRIGRSILLPLSVLCTVLACTLIAHVDDARAVDPGKVLRVSFNAGETDFDPVVRNDQYSQTFIENIFDSMLQYDYLARPVKLIPNTLEAMPEVSDNGTTYLLRIRKGIYFTPDAVFQGKKRELAADDYSFSLRRQYDPKLKSPWLWVLEGKIVGADEVMERARKSGKYDYDAAISGLEVVDRYTLRIRLKKPDYNFLYVLAMPTTAAMAREVVQAYGEDIGAHPVGTGPFMLKDWKRSHKIVLEANPGFREVYFASSASGDDPADQEVVRALQGKRLPNVGRVEVSIIEEEQPRYLAFLNAEHDYLERLYTGFVDLVAPGGKLAPSMSKKGIRHFREADIDLVYTYFNMSDPVLGGYTPEKVALRRALSLAYDNQEELKILRKSQGILAQSPIPPGAAGYDPEFVSPMAEYNPAKAKALLDLFGYVDRNADGYREMPDGKPLKLVMGSAPDSEHKEFDQLWKKHMDQIGIRIDFKKAKFPDLIKESKLGTLQMRQSAWLADFPDGENFLQLLYGPNSGEANDSRFRLPEFDRLYEKSKLMPDSPERTRLYQEMTRLMLVYSPWKLHVHRIRNHLLHPWIKGYKKHPIHLAPWRYIDIDVAQQEAARR
jgi:oligopeptide transport system substrate-binding protein